MSIPRFEAMNIKLAISCSLFKSAEFIIFFIRPAGICLMDITGIVSLKNKI
jgi:hypothetical protein